MKQATHFQLQSGWKVLLTDMGLNSADILTLAGLPADLFNRTNVKLSAQEYFDICLALETLVPIELLPLKLGQAISVESFDPLVFACLCSPDFRVALSRLQQYKRLMGPMTLSISDAQDGVSVAIECYGYKKPLPISIMISEVIFLTKLAQIATRTNIVPLQVTLPHLPNSTTPYEHILGNNIQSGPGTEIVFAFADAHRPFLTENLAMWQYFEPELKNRLSQLDRHATVSQRVASVLLEMLPGGASAIETVANRLAMSKRTLQRKLHLEGANFQDILKHTRQELAQHYLKDSNLSSGEISFLLGFQDTNSFIRAYSDWTGQTPGEFRHSALQQQQPLKT